MNSPLPSEPGAWGRLCTTIERIGLKSLTTGNFVWFVLLIIAASIVWKMESADLREVLLKVLVTYGWLGYPLTGIVIFVSTKILKWRERFYQQEMTRMAETRNQAIQRAVALELPLTSSKDKKEIGK